MTQFLTHFLGQDATHNGFVSLRKLQWLYCTLGIPGVSSEVLTTRLRLPVKLRLLTSCKGQLPQTHGENEWHPKHLETPKTNSDLLLSLSLDNSNTFSRANLAQNAIW